MHKRNSFGLLAWITTALAFTELHAADGDGGGPVANAETGKKKTEYVQITMTDGTIVEFPTTAKAKKTILQDEKGAITGVRFDFVNGQTRTILLTQVLPLLERLAAHGISQKGGDSYASEKDVDDSVEALDDTLKMLLEGKWSEGREGGFAGVSILAKALSEAFGKTLDEVRAILKEMSPKEKMQIRQLDGVREIVQRLEAEKAKGAGVDVNALKAKFA